VCGASRFSACELDATDPKVNRAATAQPPSQRWAVAVRVREAKRFVIFFCYLPSSSIPQHRDSSRIAQPADHMQV
jgi:hypothetical protein